ncbi:MAG: cytochrome c-type biogenesis protein CcmH [Pseudomonadota bacterium]
MKNCINTIFVICIFLFPVNQIFAKVELHEFDSPQQQKLYKTLSAELRCLVCQNQNLADSNAELAQDMRQKTFELVKENKSKAEIVDYWVTRYGDFVLYNPPFKSSTLILWLGPFFLLILALYFGKRIIQSSKTRSETLSKQASEQSIKDHQAVQKLLANDLNNK